jgi:holo-[acyl-carrier protein] synthase
MIRGIGLDAVNIERLKSWEDDEAMLTRFFHPDELEGARKRAGLTVASLAARFAAKEAFGKALGTGLAGFSLREVCVLNDQHGRPDLHLYGRARAALASVGGKRTFVSLTHEHDYAIAVVIIEA